MSQIKDIVARKIKDSRGTDTLEVEITTEDARARDSVPSGTSTGGHEAALVEVDIALKNINEQIKPALLGMEVSDQKAIDQKMIELDGTEDKSKLGANAILGVSLAVARTAAESRKQPLYRSLNQAYQDNTDDKVELKVPTPMMVMLCGGKHAKGTDRSLCIQEFLSVGEVADGTAVWHSLEERLKEKNIPYSVGLEGAFAPELESDDKAIEILSEAIEKAATQTPMKIGLDVAGNNCRQTNLQILDYFKKYHLFSIEDPFGEEDWARFGQLKLELEEAGEPFLLIGDDIFSTNRKLLEKGIDQIVANGIIIKPNQVGTLTEVFEVVKLAKKAGYSIVVSHRSGETMDSFIADLAVAIAADYLKAGAPIPPERLTKYERLRDIAAELKS